MVDAIARVEQYSLDGQRLREIVLPGPGDASGFRGKARDAVTCYSSLNCKNPARCFDSSWPAAVVMCIAARGQILIELAMSQNKFSTVLRMARVPMVITRRADLDQNQTYPTMLYGYDGFDIRLTPRFSSTVAAWLKAGGVYVVPNLRGGGEYGKSRHDAGTQMQKQNVFDDFGAATE